MIERRKSVSHLTLCPIRAGRQGIMGMSLKLMRERGEDGKTTFRFPGEDGRMYKTSVKSLPDFNEADEIEALRKAVDRLSVATTETKDVQAPFDLPDDVKSQKSVKRTSKMSGIDVADCWAELTPLGETESDEQDILASRGSGIPTGTNGQLASV